MSSSPPQAPTVTLSALRAGHLTLPEHLFVTNADPGRCTTVPSLAFLIRHAPSRTNLVFDLGVKRDLAGYAPAMSSHIAARQPAGAGVDGEDDAAASLCKGGFDAAADIDFVVLSHVHWDHVGTPADFANAIFLVGSGTLEVLRDGAGPRYPGELFNSDELPWDRTREFPPVDTSSGYGGSDDGKGGGMRTEGYYERHAPKHTLVPEGSKAKSLPCMISSSATVEENEEKGLWKPLACFPHTLDLYGDGSVYVVDAPGHIYGHVNLLVRIRQDKYVYLGGDCCHDPRILAGEKEFAEYPDSQGGGLRSVHTDTAIARNTLDRIKRFAETGVEIEGRRVEVEVVVAHDGVWAERNRGRFWPGTF
ncbi:Metallo-hydrolase/oxidoreductase [Apiospora sp. TS-2023a]